MKRFFLAAVPLLMVSCAPIRKPTDGMTPIVIAEETTRDCKKARVILPAGTYTPELQMDRGDYYLAPADLRTEGVLLGGKYRGGLFIARDGRQAAWFGDARHDTEERPSTLLGAIGAGAPKLWPISPPISFTPAPTATKR